MTEYRIEVRPSARTALFGLDKPARRKLQRTIDDLANNPRPPGAVPLTGAPTTLSIRVGDHRVLYTTQDHELLILVIDTNQQSRSHDSP